MKKMKKVKKIVSLSVVFAMTATMLAGCGGDNKSNTGGNSDGNNTASGDSEEPYEVVIEMLGSGVAQAGTAEVEAAINELTVPAINCTVKFREIPIADHATQLGLLGTDSDKIDIVFVGYTTSMQTLVANGLLVDIGDLLNQYGQEMLDKAGILMDACKVGDGTYCVPGNYYPATVDSLAYDKEKVEEFNIQIPDNPEDSYDWLRKYYAAIKDSDYDGYGFSAGDGVTLSITGHNMEKFGASMGAEAIYGVLLDMEKDTNIVNVYNTDEYLEEVKFRRECWEKGYMVPDSLTSGNNEIGAMMARQIIGRPSPVNATSVYNNKNLVGYEQACVPLGEAVLTGSSIPEYGLGVTITSERPDKAVQLLNMIMTNADLANLMNYGIEGKHYVKVSDRIIENPEGVDFSNAEWGMQICSYGDSAQIYHKTPFTEEWYDTVDEYGADKATPSQAFGYVFNSESVKTQVAAVTSVVAEYNPSLMCGLVEDVESRVAEFNAALETAGINDIIAENQRQFDEWRASKGK